MSSERREYERYDVNIDVNYAEGENFLFSYVENISEMGIFIRSDSPLAIGTLLKMKLGKGDEVIEIQGRVVWVNPVKADGDNPNPGMGVEFEELSDEMRNKVVDLVRTVAYLNDKPGEQ